MHHGRCCWSNPGRPGSWSVVTQLGVRKPKLDEQTPYFHIQGHNYQGEYFIFVAPVMARIPKAIELPKMADRWIEGRWLGKTDLSDEHVVPTRDGVMKTRAVRLKR